MPQAKSGGSRSSSSTGRSSASKRSTGASSREGRRTSSARRSTASKARTGSGAKTRSASSSARAASASTSDPLEAAGQRIRKLNERIIEAGKGASEVTLTSYEKALKMIATSIERGPGKSDVEWVSTLATAQAKFIRDLTSAWTSAARERLK